MPKVSIVIPVYNAVLFIDKCMDSVLNQTHRDFEIVLVNDGSTDESVSILQQLQTNGIPLKIITQENQGQAVARNKGVQHAQGEFICFVDIDDYVDPRMLEELVKAQMQTDADLVWCNAFVEKNGEIVGTLDEGNENSGSVNKNYILHNASPWRKIVRKSLIVNNNLFFPSIRFYEDIAIVPTYGVYTDKITYVDKPLYYYLLHEGSTMHQEKYNVKLECIFEAMQILHAKAEESGFYTNYEEELEWIVIDHLLHAASLRFFAFGKEQALYRVVDTIQEMNVGWRQNLYFRKQDWKYKLICRLFYTKRYKVLRWMLK